ncbi:hypothetical protein FNV43_RR19870 [Rhamnella rubrinervis]|uniref:Uncharacterized protein n=1 Tax=Rhamnella rubrinervis TaxID=2594499 RepID=A0A8K0DTE9_9ROSA|nr:hypothetical protein FNV43_RR19870 [Rhamnella rubrinervis]
MPIEIGLEALASVTNQQLMDVGHDYYRKASMKSEEKIHRGRLRAICLDKIVMQKVAFVKGCERANWLV